MDIARLVATGTAVLIVGGCDGPGLLGPAPEAGASPALAVAAAASHPVDASGHFDAVVDFATLTLTPRGSNCLLQVDGHFIFSGTIVGVANGHTTALVFATCDEVASKPPGSDPDVFTSDAVFDGTVNGEPAHSRVMYQGRVQPGGHISGHLLFSNGVSGKLDTEGQVAVGGTYEGSLVAH